MTQENNEAEIVVPAARETKITTEAQRQVERLQQHRIVELEAVRQFHEWLDSKRFCRQACRVIGESRTGKTLACAAYQHKHMSRTTLADCDPPLSDRGQLRV